MKVFMKLFKEKLSDPLLGVKSGACVSCGSQSQLG